MKITYTPNPLCTVIELDEHEQEAFKLKIKIEQYEDMIFSAHFALTNRLKDYGPKPQTGSGWDKVGGFEAHIPRWKAEAKSAYEWLLAYQAQHFPKETQ